MLRVKDAAGAIIPGLFKDNLGNIIVKNDAEYNRYCREKQQVDLINNLNKEVSDLKSMVKDLISALDKNA